MYKGIYPTENFGILDALLVSVIAMVLVMLVLFIIILVAHGIGLGMDKVESTMNIKPRPENKLLDEDPDAIIAALAATIDFHKETGKNAELISITKIEE